MYKQNHGRGPMMKTGHGLPKEMTSPLKQDKDHKTGTDMVERQAFSEGEEPYTISVKKGSTTDLLSNELGAVPNNLRHGSKMLGYKRDPLVAGLTPAQRKSRSMRNHNQQIAEEKAGTYK